MRQEEKRKRNKYVAAAIVIIVAAAFAAAVLFALRGNVSFFSGLENTLGGRKAQNSPSSPAFAGESGGMSVYFIDVGEGDCSLIVCDGKTMLIDSGERASYDSVAMTLDSLGISRLDYIVATHMHSDHIGALSEVLNDYGTDLFLMPKLPLELTPTSKAYSDMLEALVANDVEVRETVAGDTYSLGSAVICVLGPLTTETENVNDTSAIIKITYGEVSYLFTGDAEAEEETALLSAGADLKADVLKVAHHGSGSSSCSEFLRAVSPLVCIISVGAYNDYGHPNDAVVRRLSGYTKKIYRTDVCGTVCVRTDGEKTEVTF
ncbi:MAG: MBL fold metallo-hydrolase [Clostridia bacterium]|nr:MBL fold metallo-hydrolase [Clostridia bacterium]